MDDGEDNPARNRTPIRVADGDFAMERLAAKFRQPASDIDPEVGCFVVVRLASGS